MTWVLPDSEDILEATAALPEQLAASAATSAEVAGLPSPEGIGAIVVLGMGGSGVAGEILRAIGKEQLRVPVVLVGDYSLPSFVDSSTLVFAVSFSGQTEETLEAAETAVRKGARLIAVSGGGRLAELAVANRAPVFPIMPGLPQPRVAVAATAAPLLVACERLGLLGGIAPGIDKAVAQLRERRDSLADGAGMALEIAQRLDRTIPLIQGAEGIGAVAARWW